VILVAAAGLIVVALVIGGVAWYTRVANISGLTLDVAEFDVRANYMDGKFVMDAEDYMNVEMNKAAPGTIGCIPVLVTSSSQTEVTYSLTLDLKKVAPEFLERVRFFYYDSTDSRNEAYVEWYKWVDYQNAVASGVTPAPTEPTTDEVSQATRELFTAWTEYNAYLAAVAAGTADDTYGEGKAKAIPTEPTTPIPTPYRTYLGGSRNIYEGIYETGRVKEETNSDNGEKELVLRYNPDGISAEVTTDTAVTDLSSNPLGYKPITGTLGQVTKTKTDSTPEERKTSCYEYIYWEWVYEFDEDECYDLETGTWGAFAGIRDEVEGADPADPGVTAADAAARYDRIDSMLGKGAWNDSYASEVDPGNFTTAKKKVKKTTKTDGKETTVEEDLLAYQAAIMVKVLVSSAQATPKEGEAAEYGELYQGTGTSFYVSQQ